VAAPALKTTPLNAAHREMGARMVDFGGWEMPLNYGSQLDEHHRVRRDCGMFDVSHMLAIDMRGASSRALLAYVLANDVAKLNSAGKALYSCLLNPAGGVIDDLIVYCFAGDWFRLIVNAACADKDYAWLAARRDEHAPAVRIEARHDLALIAVQGPRARTKVFEALPNARAAGERLAPFSAVRIDDMMLARTGYTGEDGFEIALPADAAVALWQRLEALGVAPAGLAARDTLRLEAGMNLYGQDMDENVSPLESGLAWTVDLASPRDFVGKAALAAKTMTRQQVGLLLQGKSGVLRSHQKVTTIEGDGEITSGTFSPTLGQSIALARVPVGIAPGCIVAVEVRGKRLDARVVKPPFVRHGKALVT